MLNDRYFKYSILLHTFKLFRCKSMDMDPAVLNHDEKELNFIDGTSPLQVYSVTFFVPTCSLFISVILSTSNLSDITVQLIQAISINLVLLLSLTIFCDHLGTFFLSLAIPLVVAIFCIYKEITCDQMECIKKSVLEAHSFKDINRKFIGDYRGHLLLATCISILAVDFAFFPERFSKTETYGWSIMDAGVGSFVFVHGLCSSNARKLLKEQNTFKKSMLSSLPLFILGVIRLVVTKAVGYHKVVPEYGIHWNFFFTLAFTKVICSFLSACLPFIQPLILAMLVSVVHQTLLSTGLTKFILDESRRNLIEANKEGICSLLGFVSIYFYGVQLGQFLWKSRNQINEYIYMLVMICGIGVLGWMLMYLTHINVQPVSRRMANLAYCIWVVALTSLQLSLHLAHQIINFVLGAILKKDISDCLLWKAINYNGLFYFLIANVLTGIVNLSIKTENYGKLLSFLILTVYLIILTTSVVVPYKKSVQLKFW